MRRIIEVVVLVVILTGCGETNLNAIKKIEKQTIKEKRIDTSSDEKMKKSIEEIIQSLSEKKKKEFTDAYKAIAVSGLFNSNMFTDNPNIVEKKLKEMIDGKSADEVISIGNKIIAQRGEKAQKQTNNENNEIKQIKTNEPIVINDIEITIKDISIGKLKEKRKDSFYQIPKEDFLLVKVQLKNISEGNIMTIQDTWASSILSDNFNNNYKEIGSYNYNLKNNLIDGISSINMEPKKTVIDTMIFKLPIKNATSFTIVSKPEFYKSNGDGTLKNISSGKKFKIMFNRNEL